ncbi:MULTISPECIES: Rpn family recombination-promoting nuclease/putative transposase [unclassified Treponema]|uniref:Rpn family recombination-promoting nuclease/putative transposase n=1 Tax=unclassified Treponema TaxID=2638727 RepID=UPI0020A333AC|nr:MULTISPECIES: Rpn family recombination-promoting nuclease/putative transposase [unclassified Treponema]UTC66437.1 PD-(D/E)XK nuclease family transposase [Treponema sp. OMZ 789]UTC69168.1 PD-(D/E)XK nuclease family transposase [Treponema sp. OMZ 790]UTC71881.1 PD-(D/E)XK nuclease family transposase [Treponema sp. OMZ 791]
MEKLFKITLRNDYAFKRVFGVEENKDVLQDFLECILDIPPETIADLELLDKEFHKELLNEKLGILDIKLRLKDETFIDIEIQNRWHFDFPERTLYYWSKMYNEGVKQGQDYTKLPKCITINLIGKGFNKNKRLHNRYFILEQETKEPLVSKLEIHILNLEKARLLKESQCKDDKTKRLLNWLKFIETDDPEVRKMLAETSKVMAKANDKIIIMEMSPRDKWLYDARMKYEHDRASCISEGYREGILDGEIKGRQEGFADGSYQKALETAAAFKKLGIDIDKIAQGTGLSIKEIQAL